MVTTFIPDNPTPPRPEKPIHQFPTSLAMVFVLLSAGIVASGLLFFKYQEEHFLTEEKNELGAIADLKVRQIVSWRAERLGDANVITENPVTSERFSQFLTTPGDSKLRKQLLGWLESRQRNRNYQSAAFFSPKAEMLLSADMRPEEGDKDFAALLKSVVQSKKVLVSDLRYDPQENQILMDVFAPVLQETGKQVTLVGVIVLRLDPARFLYPLVDEWPFASKTSESVLFRQDGDSVVFLNELRHEKNTALRKRLPVAGSISPAAMAVKGFEGDTVGTDYRGAPVLAAIRKVPASPWYIVAKTDEAELFEQLSEEKWDIGVTMIILIVASGIAAAFLWQNMQTRFYKKQYETEEALRLSEVNFRNMVEQSLAGVYAIQNGVLTYVNPKLAEIFGYTPEEIVRKKTPLDLTFEEDRALVQENIRKRMQGEARSLQYVFRGRRKDGNLIDLEAYGTITTIDGKPTIMGTLTEVTERKRYEEALKDSEERFRKLFEHAPDAHYLLEPDGNIVDANMAAEEITGYTRDELIGKNILTSGFLADNQAQVAAGLLGESVRGRPAGPAEIALSRRSGDLRIVEIRSMPIRIKDRSLVLGMAHDITAQKAREGKMRFQSAALESAANGIVITDREGSIVWVNKAFTTMTGYREDEVIGHNPRLLRSGKQENTFYKDLWNTILAGNAWHGQLINRRKDGTLYTEEQTITPVFDEQGRIDNFVAIKQDITQRRTSEDKLRSSESRYRSLFTNMLEGYAFCQMLFENGEPRDFRYLDVNPKFEELTGLKNVVGRNVTEVIPGIRETNPELFETYARVSLTGKPEKIETYVPGLEMWFSISVYSPKKEHFAAVFDVITERKHAENALRDSEERYRRLFESAKDGILILDAKTGKIIDANPHLTEMLGYSRNELMGISLWEISPFKDVEVSKTIFRKMQSEGYIRYENIPLETRDGHIIDVEFVSNIYPIDHTKVIQCNIRDVTERRRAEEQMRLSDTILQKVGSIVMVVDSNASITYANPSLRNVLGYEPSEVLGNGWWRISRTDPKDAEKEKKRIIDVVNGKAPPNPSPFERLIRHNDGSNRWILWQETPGPRNTLISVGQDVTEKKALEEQFLRSQRLESIGTLAGGIAHDLNNVLAPIMLAAEMAKSKAAQTQTPKLIDDILKSAKRGADIVKQVLTFSRGTSGERIPLQVRHLMGEMEKIARETFPKTIVVESDIPKNLWPIMADATQVHQVLMNLCVNARDAMPKGGTLRLTAENMSVDEHFTRMQPTFSRGKYIRIAVSDTGSGIPDDIKDKIFDPFFTTKEIGKGTGLGLATVQKIVKDHGGIIETKSLVGRGTSFTIYLPAIHDGETQPEEREHKEPPVGHDELILVVDDETVIQEITKSILESHGYNVVTASNGIDAVAIYAERKSEIRAVITDMAMPVMDGEATIRILQNLQPTVRVVATSGHIPEDKLAAINGLGVKSIIEKPFTAEQLLQTLYDVLHESNRN